MHAASLRRLNRQALDPARNVVVSACAGSGKTWLLVSRIVRELLAGAEPSQILAITFTRKAAEEMAGRLRAYLRELAVVDDVGVRAFLRQRELDPAAIDALLGRAREQFERVLTAEPPITITTFHGWFLQLLRNAPLEAGALGAVSLIERTSDLLGEAWTRLMSDCQRAPQGEPARAVEALFAQYGLHNTRQLLRSFVAHRSDWWAYAGNGDQAVAGTLEHLAQALTVAPDLDVRAELLREPGCERAVRSLAELLCLNTPTDCIDGNAICTALEQDCAAALFDAVRKAVLRHDDEPKVRRPAKAQAQRLGTEGQIRFLELHAEIAAAMRRACNALADQASYRANAWGLAAGVALLERFQDIKRERQLVDFADVEWLAYASLAKSDHAVTLQYKLDNRYRHILLDEFQDTNPLQWLALRAWLDAARQSGEMPKLFVVGDPKQSIYRFRRAEPQLFVAAQKLVLEEGGVALSQDESFRCAQAVLDVVNGVFEADPLVPEFEAHAAHRPKLPGRVEILPLTRLDEQTLSTAAAGALELRNPLHEPRVVPEDRRREDEAQMLAERLTAIVSDWRIVDEAEPSTTRPVRFGDIMILVRQRTHLEVYERALRRAQIPYLTSRQGGLLGTLEAEDLSALLAFLVAPFDDLKLAHVLRSPLFACSDDELIAIAQAPGKTWWERLLHLVANGAGENLRRAQRLLTQWRERADAEPVHDQLDRIYFEGDVLRRYRAAVPEAMRAAVVANLQAFIQHALDVDSGRYPSLPRFLGQLREMRAAPGEEAPDEGLLGSHGNAVRILTIHGAKGLEAPIVWLLNSSAPRVKDPGYSVLVDWPAEAEAPTSFSLWTRIDERSGAQCELAAVEEQRAAREELNLLYVAMTRARQALFVSGCDLKTSSDSWYARVRAAVVALNGGADDSGSAVQYGQALSSASGDSVRRAATPAHPVQMRIDYAGEDLQRPVPTGQRRALVTGAGQGYGTAFHRLMELLADAPARSADSVRKQLRLPPKGFDALWSQARGLLADPKLVRFFNASHYRRALNEVPIVIASGEMRRIDRLVEFDHEVWVLDYKTGSRASVLGSALEAEYRSQVSGYCEALGQVYANKPVLGKILFADGSQIDL